MDYEFYFLNPTKGFLTDIKTYLIKKGFEELSFSKKSDEWRFHREEENVNIWHAEDFVGVYIGILCTGISKEDAENSLLTCPECHSSDLKVTILYCWRNAITERLFNEGKLEYGPGAYDRLGTRPPTHRCMRCGCKWHNGAAMLRWNDIIKQGGILTKEVLGVY